MKLLRLLALKPTFRKLWANKRSRAIVLGAAAVLLIGLALLLQVVLFSDKPATMSAQDYKDQLEGQVTDQEGAPRDGRDPASQQQNSLASSASKPTGVGQRTDQTTIETPTDHDDHSAHDDHHQQDAIGLNGCYVDYGIQGEQCLPAHAGGTNGQLTCSSVHGHGFPNGIKVTGTDRFHLDTNHDGVACDNDD